MLRNNWIVRRSASPSVIGDEKTFENAVLLRGEGQRMSRYGLWTEDENLEVFMGFEEGLGTFFLTIADGRTCKGEAGTYLFHNYDDHPNMGMTLDEIVTTLGRFGLEMPTDLFQQLSDDAKRSGVKTSTAVLPPEKHTSFDKRISVLGWQKVV